jgi:hypothetical protein
MPGNSRCDAGGNGSKIQARARDRAIAKEELANAAALPSSVGNNKAAIGSAIAQFEANNLEGGKRTVLKVENHKGMLAELEAQASDIGGDPKRRRAVTWLWRQLMKEQPKNPHRVPVDVGEIDIVAPRAAAAPIGKFDGPKASFVVSKKDGGDEVWGK